MSKPVKYKTNTYIYFLDEHTITYIQEENTVTIVCKNNKIECISHDNMNEHRKYFPVKAMQEVPIL